MASKKLNYEQRQARKQFVLRVTVIIVGLTLLVGVVGSYGIQALVGA
jgi:hypothetical protein